MMKSLSIHAKKIQHLLLPSKSRNFGGVTFGFPDLGKKGNFLGLVLGAEPYLTRMGGNPVPFKVDVPIHVEAYYRYQVNDFISITPGIIWLTTPNQDANNPDAVIATIRTTFSF
jgi:hypothetical protein